MKKNRNLKKRVLVVEPSANLWGSERSLLFLLESLKTEKDWKIGIICPDNMSFINHLDNTQLAIFPVLAAELHLKNKFYRILLLWKLALVTMKFRPSLFYVNQAGIARLVYYVAWIFRVPMVTHVRLLEDCGYVSNLPKDKKILKKYVCVSEFIRSTILERGSVEVEKVTMLYCPHGKISTRNRDSFDTEKDRYFICVGRVIPLKRQDTFIQAIGEINKKGKNVKGVIVGSETNGTRFTDSLKKLICDLNLEKQIKFLNFKDNVYPYIQNSIGLVCSSDIEPLGRVILEAWAERVIPIAYAHSGGAAEIIIKSQGGLLYEKQSGSSLASAMLEILAMKDDDKQKLLNNGSEWLSANHAPDNFVESMKKVWFQACG